MISWQSIMSVFNTKGTLLKWLKTLDQSLKDGVLETVTVNSVSEGVITLTFNFADGSTITTPQIDIPQGAQGPQGIPGTNGTNGESFNPMGEWGTDNEYHPFDYVTYQGSSYLCTQTIIDGTDAPPIDTEHWQLVAEKGDQGEPGTAPDIPTPTTADNGKVLGVENGEYALQEASGGGTQLYLHWGIMQDTNAEDYYVAIISTNSEQYSNNEQIINQDFIAGKIIRFFVMDKESYDSNKSINFEIPINNFLSDSFFAGYMAGGGTNIYKISLAIEQNVFSQNSFQITTITKLYSAEGNIFINMIYAAAESVTPL